MIERMNRFGAFAIHLGISLIIFIFLGYLVLFHWYPDFFFASDGGWQGIRIIAFVDFVLGPVLTLVVCNVSKPKTELRRDLTIVATIQAVCLTAGVWVVYSERPIAMVFSDGSFHSMTIDDYIAAGQPIPDMNAFGGTTPKWVSVRLPEDPEEQSKIRVEAMESRVPISTLSRFYQPFEPTHINPQLDSIRFRTPYAEFLNEFLALHGGTAEDYLFVPFGTRYTLALMAMRKADEEMIFLAVPGGLTTTSSTSQLPPS